MTECAATWGSRANNLSRLLNGHIGISPAMALSLERPAGATPVLATSVSLLRSRPGAPPTDGCITARRSVPRSAREPALGALDLLAAVLFLALLAMPARQEAPHRDRRARRPAVSPVRPAPLLPPSRLPRRDRVCGPPSTCSPSPPQASGCTGPPSAASASPCRLQVPGLAVLPGVNVSADLTVCRAQAAPRTCCITTPDAGSPERTCTPRPRQTTSARPASMGSTLAAISPAL